MLIEVSFKWDDSYGECYDCGLPAAFLVGDRKESADTADIRCAVCAANAAADGDTIRRLDGGNQ